MQLIKGIFVPKPTNHFIMKTKSYFILLVLLSCATIASSFAQTQSDYQKRLAKLCKV